MTTPAPAPFPPFPEPAPVATRHVDTSRTDALAVASLVASLASPLTAGLSAPVGVGLGIVALGRIRRSGMRGRALAVAGIAVGSVVVLAGLALVVLFTAASLGTASASS